MAWGKAALSAKASPRQWGFLPAVLPADGETRAFFLEGMWEAHLCAYRRL